MVLLGLKDSLGSGAASASPPARARVEFRRLDLTMVGSERILSEALADLRIDAVAHLPLLTAPDDPGYAHELEAVGTLRMLAGVEKSKVHRLVVASTTWVYGARPDNPGYLSEERTLKAAPRSRYLADKVEMEKQATAFQTSHPDCSVTILRFPIIVGPEVYDPFAAYLTRSVAPTIMGYDPLVQLVHVDDAVRALLLSLTRDVPGQFNIGSRGVLPLSGVLSRVGITRLPLPHPIAGRLLQLLSAVGIVRTPPSLTSFLRYACVGDLTRAEKAGLAGQRSIEEAVEAVATHGAA